MNSGTYAYGQEGPPILTAGYQPQSKKQKDENKSSETVLLYLNKQIFLAHFVIIFKAFGYGLKHAFPVGSTLVVNFVLVVTAMA